MTRVCLVGTIPLGIPERDYMQKVLRLRHPEKYVNSGVLIFNNKIFHLDYPTDFILIIFLLGNGIGWIKTFS